MSPRDAEQTRQTILAAAEELFAAQGFAATSLQAIADAANLSRGAPNYFFGSKAQLYQTVLAAVLEAEHAAAMQTRARVAEADGRQLIEAVIRDHIDFLVARPTFLQLMTREALNGGEHLKQTGVYLTVLEAGMALIKAEQAAGHLRAMSPNHLLLSVLALCWFPFTHADTLTHSVGLSVTDPAFIEAHKQHVIAVLLRGILEP